MMKKGDRMTIVGSGNSHGFHWSQKAATKLISEYLGFTPYGLPAVPWDILRCIGIAIQDYNRDKTILENGLDFPILRDVTEHKSFIKALFESVEKNFGVNLKQYVEISESIQKIDKLNEEIQKINSVDKMRDEFIEELKTMPYTQKVKVLFEKEIRKMTLNAGYKDAINHIFKTIPSYQRDEALKYMQHLVNKEMSSLYKSKKEEE